MTPPPPDGQVPQLVALVDDEPQILQALKAFLVFKGSLCSLHPSAESLLGALIHRDGQLWMPLEDGREAMLNSAVLDLNLPGMSGADLVVALRRMQPDLRIVMVTAATDQQLHERAHDLEGVKHLTKPFTLESLENALLQG